MILCKIVALPDCETGVLGDPDLELLRVECLYSNGALIRRTADAEWNQSVGGLSLARRQVTPGAHASRLHREKSQVEISILRQGLPGHCSTGDLAKFCLLFQRA